MFGILHFNFDLASFRISGITKSVIFASSKQQGTERYDDKQIAVSQSYGCLVLSSPDGQVLANSEQTQIVRADQVTSHLIFCFQDGSVHEETTYFQRATQFRADEWHVVEKGPAFTSRRRVFSVGLAVQMAFGASKRIMPQAIADHWFGRVARIGMPILAAHARVYAAEQSLSVPLPALEP